jgi:membrane-bound lytic murein transglycosylase D
MMSMEKKRTVTKICLSSSLAVILAGCVGQTGNLKPENISDKQTPSVKESAAPSASHETTTPELAGVKTVNIAPTPALPPKLALNDDLLLDEEAIPEEADGDPTAEEEGVIGEAVFDAAQELLDKIASEEDAQHNSSNIWPRIRTGFTLPDRDHPRVQPDREWFTNHQAYLDRTFTRAAPYLHYITEEVKARGMPMEIALLPVVESAYQPFAYSRSRAAGIWQFIPGTANLYGLKIDWWYDGRRDIQASTGAALTYLQKLHDQFDGDWLLALAAYNSGEGTVARAIAKNQSRGLGTRYWDLDLPRETESYVPRLLAIADIVDNPERFGLSIRTIPDKPVLQTVDTGAQLDLAIAADLAGLTLDELYIFNPAFNSWATAPNGPHQLLLPLEKVEEFQAKLAALAPEERIKQLRHEVGRGESLKQIAAKYKTTVATLQRTNNISGNNIQRGKTLLVPVASRSLQEYILSADQRYETKQNTPKGSSKSYHTVRPGESLWRISTKHKVAVASLAAWNSMAPDDTLRPGQKLVIWKGDKPKTRLSRADSDGKTQRIQYRVRSGDSLARISEKFNVSVKELKKWNPKARSKHIQPGQKLVLYVDVTRMAKG